MNFRKLYFTLFLFLSVSLSAFSQTDTIGINTIIARTAKLANTHPLEKVYLHFDKPYYAIGDTVWFKAYITLDIHQPSQLSKIVYVDVISSQDSIVQSLKLQVTGSVAFGDVTLSAPLYRQGNYHFRAYTTWMRNDDPAYFFNKTIAVGNFNNYISTNISLSGSTKGNTSKVTAKVIYKDATGKPYANKKVSWKALNDDETIGKGKGTTTANGVLDVSFTTNKTDGVASASLVTDISVTDEKTITNAFPLTHALDQPDVQFFPEGGELIAGLRSRVAVKAVKPDGLGMDVKVAVTDNSGAVVVEPFTTQHLGMGVFAFQPEMGKTYKANITFADGTQASYNLPNVQAEGMSLSVYNTNRDSITVKLSANPAFFQKNQNKLFYILGQNGETICYGAQTLLKNSIYSAPIAKSKLPSGVIKFTILTDRGEPLAERVTFVLRNDILNVTLKTPQATYAPRQKVALNVSALAAGQPAEANLSVTVLDETKVPFDENSETTILTNLLLTSELKGYIEKPNYYFNHPDDKTAADMDVLMLTQGYRRFSFREIVANKNTVNKFSPELGITISGTLRDGTGLPISKGIVTMIVGDRKSSVNTVANTVGEFKFSKLMFPDSTKLTINAKNNTNANNMMILLDNSTYQPATLNITAPDAVTNIDSTMNAYLQNSKQQFTNIHTLKQVEIRSTSFVKKPSHLDYPVLTGLSMDPNQVITGDRLTICPFLAQCLQGIAFGITVYDEKAIITRSYSAGDVRPMAIYVNGMAVDFNYLQNVATSDIETVEVFMNDGLSGINRGDNTNGVLVVNTKVVKHVQMSKADILAALAPQYSAVNTIFRGYTQARAFYSPKYDATKTYSLGGDLRSTIYWNPKVVTDKTGAATLEFFNADTKGSYRAIIEGFDTNGNLGRYVYHYTVQ